MVFGEGSISKRIQKIVRLKLFLEVRSVGLIEGWCLVSWWSMGTGKNKE